MSDKRMPLVDWLNKSRGSVSQSRDAVCKLLTALRGLEQTLKEHPIEEVPERGLSVSISASPGALLRDAVNKQLAGYQFTPTLLHTHEAPIRWLSPDSNDSKEIECTMIRMVCDLHNDGSLSRVRECICGEWFMARSDNQQCCSTGCRQKKWGKTDKGKAAGKKASKDSYNNTDRQPKLKRVKKAIEQWKLKSATFRERNDWKEWVAGACGVNKAFITRAVNKKEIVEPASRYLSWAR